MATRLLLAELARAYRAQNGVAVRFESVGGVDAARRVAAGEPFDVVVLAAEAIDRLIAAGHVLADGRTDLVRSPVAVAVRAGTPRPDIGSEQALIAALRAAPSIGLSTGPSGSALLELFERWGILEEVRPRLVQAPPGLPVARLVAGGEAALGFQQWSEMKDEPGIVVLGPLPAGCAITSTFTAGVCARTRQPAAARALIAFLQAPAADAAKRRHGMEPV